MGNFITALLTRPRHQHMNNQWANLTATQKALMKLFKSNRIFKLFSIFIACTFLNSLPAWSQEDGYRGTSEAQAGSIRQFSKYSPSIGFRTGVAATEGSEYESSAEYGAEIGFEPTPMIGLGLEFGTYEDDPGGLTQELTRTKLLAKAQYNIRGGIPVLKYSYIGIGVGPVWDEVANDTETKLGVAPMIGFDIPIPNKMSHFSLGLNASYLVLEDSDLPDVFALNGTVKYWF